MILTCTIFVRMIPSKHLSRQLVTVSKHSSSEEPKNGSANCNDPNLDTGKAELEKWIRTNYPETITLVLTAHDRDAYLSGMIEAGVAGYLDKKLRAGQLISAIRRAARGEFLFDKNQLERAQHWREEVSRKWESLSDREREVLQMPTEGTENKAISASLGITVNTVEKHLENIYRKLRVKSRTENQLNTVTVGDR